MTNEEMKIVHKRYNELKLTNDQHKAIYDCYMQGINIEGHVWVSWTDVERLLCYLFEVEE